MLARTTSAQPRSTQGEAAALRSIQAYAEVGMDTWNATQAELARIRGKK
ncbi:hypothetical protein [Polaromonas sp.]